MSRITVVWALLVLATLTSFTLRHGAAMGFRSATVAILVIALIKVRYVMLDFMELRFAPRALRMLSEGWIVLVGSILVSLFLGNAQ